MERQLTQPLQSPDLNPVDGLVRNGRKGKGKRTNTCSASLGPSSRRLETVSGNRLMKLLKRRLRACEAAIKAKGGYSGGIENRNHFFSYFTLFLIYYLIPHVIIQSCGVFSENLLCK